MGTRCKSKAPEPPQVGSANKPDLVARGKTVYQINCSACHNVNPKLVGPLGPELFGASRELIEARVLHAKYPDGYKPKRSTAVMPALPSLAAEIDALHAFVNSAQ